MPKHSYRRLLFTVLLTISFLAAVSCAGTNGQFAEGLRVIAGKGGTKEKVNTIPEIAKITRQLAKDAPHAAWQTMLSADETDILEFLDSDHVLVGKVQLSSAISDPSYGPLQLFDVHTGKQLWETARDDLPWGNYSIMLRSPLILLHGESPTTTTFMAVEKLNGQIIWKQTFSRPYTTALMPGGDTLYVGEIHSKELQISTIQVKTGERLWAQTLSLPAGDSNSSAALVADTQGLFITADRLYHLAADSGRSIWSAPLPWQEVTHLSLADQGLVVAGPQGLVLYDPIDGKPRWKSVDFGADILSILTPAQAADRIFVTTRKDQSYAVHCVLAQNGNIRWQYKTMGPLTSDIVYDNEQLFFTTSFHLGRLRARTGRIGLEQLPSEMLSSEKFPDILEVRDKVVVVAREMIGVAAFDPNTLRFAWGHLVTGEQAAHFWYKTRESEYNSVAPQRIAIEEQAKKDARWWLSWTASVKNQMKSQAGLQQHAMDSTLGSFDQSMLLFQYSLALSTGIEHAIRDAAVAGLMKRKMMEMGNSLNLHLNSIQGHYYIRPYYENGTGLILVDLDSGKMSKFIVSGPNIGMERFGLQLPTVAIDAVNGLVVTTGIGMDPDKWQKYVKFKLGMPYPFVLRFNINDLSFK